MRKQHIDVLNNFKPISRVVGLHCETMRSYGLSATVENFDFVVPTSTLYSNPCNDTMSGAYRWGVFTASQLFCDNVQVFLCSRMLLLPQFYFSSQQTLLYSYMGIIWRYISLTLPLVTFERAVGNLTGRNSPI